MTPSNTFITPEGNTIRLIESLEDIQQHEIDLIRTVKSIAIDSETTGLNPRSCLMRLLQVAPVVQRGDQFLAVYPSTCFVFDLFKLTEEALLAGFTKANSRSLPNNLIDFFKHLLGADNNKIGHNILFDMSFLFYELGEDWLPPGKWVDTLILAKIYNAGINCENSLKACLRRYAKIEVSKELQKSDWSAYNLSREQLFYAAGDVFHLGYLARFLFSKLKEERLEQIVNLELGINKLMLSPMIHGWNFDKALAEETLKQLVEERDQARDRFLETLDNTLPAEYKLPRNPDGSFNLRPKATGRGADKLPAGFNPGSTKQLAEKFIACGIKLGQTAKGNYQVDQNELAFIRADYPVVDAYLTFRKALTSENQCEKLIEKVETRQGQDRIYFNLNQMGTDTGRCIAAGTLISIVGGDIPIEKVKPGMYAYCYTEEGKLTARKVVKKFNNGYKKVITLIWTSYGHQGGEGILECTPDHLIKTRDRGWVKAKDLIDNERVYHLTRLDTHKDAANSIRPRLFAANCLDILEQQLIKKEIFKCANEMHIHHIDFDSSNNDLSNLCVLTHTAHTKLHAKDMLDKNIISSETLRTGDWNPKNLGSKPIQVGKFSLLRMLAFAKGRPTMVPMDFNTFKNKCKEACIDLKEVSKRYNCEGIYLNKATIIRALEANQTTDAASKALRIGTRALKERCEKYKVAYSNHNIWVSKTMPSRMAAVYDLEVEDLHNYIANGVCVHNCSSSGPNLQQTPRRKEFRRLFRAQPGYKLIVADYSGMELRVAAEVGNIQSMITAFANNEDLHAITASGVSGVPISEVTKEQRTVGKILNFSQLYGGGVNALKRQAAAGYGVLWSDEEAEINRNKFFTTFPEIKQWHEAVKNVCNDPRKKAVYTVLGRRRWLIGSAKIADDELMASPGEVGSYPLDRLTVRSNTMVQGSSADVVKLALKFIAPMLSLTATTGFKARFVAQIHDEIVLEVREDCVADWLDLLQTNMIEAGKAVCKRVVLETEAHAGDTWSEAK